MHCKDFGGCSCKAVATINRNVTAVSSSNSIIRPFSCKETYFTQVKVHQPSDLFACKEERGCGECTPTTALELLVNNVCSIPLTRIQVREEQQAVCKSCSRSQTSFFAGYCFAKLSHIGCKFLLSFLQLWKFCVLVTWKRELNSTNYAILH